MIANAAMSAGEELFTFAAPIIENRS